MMSDNVIPIGGITKLDIPPDKILENNMGKFESIVIMGWDKEENEVYASSIADAGEILWLMERMKIELLKDQD